MPERDYEDVAKKLRKKAVDPAVTEKEKRLLEEKASEFEAKARSSPTGRERRRVIIQELNLSDSINYRAWMEEWLDEIVEEGYLYREEGELWTRRRYRRSFG